jgi:hypothetical protein
MTLDATEVEEAVRARDGSRVRELLRDATEAERRACAKELKAFLNEPDEPGVPWGTGLRAGRRSGWPPSVLPGARESWDTAPVVAANLILPLSDGLTSGSHPAAREAAESLPAVGVVTGSAGAVGAAADGWHRCGVPCRVRLAALGR